MTTLRQLRSILMYAVLALAIGVVLSPGTTTAAYSEDNQQYQDQGQNQGQFQGQDQGYPSRRQDQSQIRNMRLEQQIASRLRQQGYGTQGEIMILATGNEIILLGTVPTQRAKNGVENIAKQASSGASVDNKLHVNAQARRLPDAELEKDTYDKMGDDLSQSVQVRAQNGTVTLQGQLDNWNQVADAIDAAFAAGATQVNSQFSVAAAGSAYPAYGYAPGQQGRPYPSAGQQGYQGPQGFQGQPPQGAMGAQTRASSQDLRLARQVASQLRQQLPPGQNVQLVQPQSIYVTVQRGTVILHGYVQDSNQRQQAQQIAQSIQGVQNVRNDLTILSTQGAAGQSSQGFSGQDQRFGGQSGYGEQSRQSYGGSSSQGTNQGYGGTSSQSQSSTYPPQGYVAPAPGSQSQSGMSSQNQYAPSSGQQGSGGTSTQSQYGQDSQGTAQQGFGGMAGQSQYGQSSQMGGQQAAMSQSDIALTQKVVQQLKQQLTSVQNIQAMRPGTIYVMAVQGNVMLHGFITDQNVKQRASQIANAIPGVRSVANTLRVIAGGAGGYPSYGYVPGQTQQQTQPGAGTQGLAGQNQGTEESAQMQFIANPNVSQNQGMAGMPGHQRMGQGMPSQADLALAQQVAQKLRQQLSGIQNVQIIRPGTIYLMVSNGTVTLNGFVSDSNAKRQAEQIAKSVSGIQNVRNSLSISGAGAGGQTFGFIPGDQDQAADQQFGNQMRGNQMQGNQYGNQSMGNQSGNQSMGNQYENQQFGNQAGNQQLEDQGADEDQSAADEPPDEGL